MNRQEAIAELKWVKKINQEILNTDAKELDIDCAWIKHWESVIEALDMAISSLETDEAYQLEYEQPTITIPVEDYMESLNAIPRERIEQMVAEIENLKDNPHCCQHYERGIKDILEVIRKYTKEQNNE